MATKPVYRTLWCLFLGLCAPALRATPNWNLTLTQAEWTTPDLIRIPFTLTGTLITVQARVDTVEGNFFFDTGASGLLLHQRHFPRNGWSAPRAANGVTGQVQVLGAMRVDTFTLDNLLATDVSADVLDLSHLETTKRIDLVGIIGYEVFRDYEVLFDYAASRLLLIRTDKKGQAFTPLPGWEYQAIDSFPLEVRGHVAIVKLQFGGKPGTRRFALDSGAEQNLLSNLAGPRFLKANFEVLKRMKLRGAGEASVEVLSGSLRNASLDSVRLRPMATLLTNLSEINAAYRTEVDGILGYEFLSQQPVSINYKKRRLMFYRPVRP